jgi:RNA polymerase sporulation-specific sigma factor
MNYLKGLELDQIAAQEKLSYEKIKSAVSRGRTKLRALIKDV